jgi:hypothetical protein
LSFNNEISLFYLQFHLKIWFELMGTGPLRHADFLRRIPFDRITAFPQKGYKLLLYCFLDHPSEK